MSSTILRIPKHLYCSFFNYRLYYTQCRHTYGVFLNICTIPFSNIVFTIRNVVIHMAYSKIAYLCFVSSLLYLLPISRYGWSSLPVLLEKKLRVLYLLIVHTYAFSFITIIALLFFPIKNQPRSRITHIFS